MRYYEDWHWHYPAALTWMAAARAHCLSTGKASLGIGSHSYDLVTLGRHASDTDILDANALARRNVEIFRIDRGGGATLHGPGQVVVYPVLSLTKLQLSVPAFTSILESAIIACLAEFGIDAHTIADQPGVFVAGAKIGAIGLHVSQGVVTHGLSLNVSNDLSLYTNIVPCRNAQTPLTSMTMVLGSKVEMGVVGLRLRELLQKLS